MLSAEAQTLAQFPDSFLFGVATAPGHVEDQLDDIWMEFGDKGGIKAFKNQVSPEKRLQFWTKPEIELDLAQKLGTQIYRLGVDWGRIHLGPDVYDQDAIARYREILQMIKKRKMKVMLTLFHFTVPKWVQEQGGWKNPKTNEYFLDFSQEVMKEYSPLVDYWITFNEPQIFSVMAYTAGVFPPGEKKPFYSLFDFSFYKGETILALENMVESHKKIYSWAHKEFPGIQIGISQHMGHHSGKNFFTRFLSNYTGEFMNWYFPKKIAGYMDYFGFNYYGAEWITLKGVGIDAEEEYSEAGRALYPDGLYLTMKEIHNRFPNLPLFVTENGISDMTDWLRPSYIIEHLLAVNKIMKEKIPVLGYIFWTVSDNMEWSDGYCPKFGLVYVDRAKDFRRIPRASYFLYQNIIKKKIIDQEMRTSGWNLVQSMAGENRPFCRARDGQTGYDTPIIRKVSAKDWRFSL